MDIQHEKGGFTMRPRTLLLFALAGLLGAAVAVLPALAAAPSEAKLEVNENCVEADWPCWAAPGSGSPASMVKIAAGGEVMFSDNTKTAANIAWTGTAPTCSSSVPVSPASPTTDWEGECKFEHPGTYRFESSTLFKDAYENYREYEIVVESASTGTTSTSTTTTTTTTTTTPTTTTTTPTTTTTTPTTTTPTATTSTQPSGGGAPTGAASTATTPVSIETPPPPGGGSPLATLALANAQHGDAVHGTVQIPAGGARLEVELLAQGASLAKVKRGGSSRVGQLVRPSAPAGKVAFSVSLDTAAKRALRRHHKLALTVKIVLTPKHGAAMTLTRSVVVR
jgi:hypothetical protein